MDKALKRKLSDETFERAMTLDRASVDDDKRTVAASLSSEFKVERFFGMEKLVHSEKAIDMSRAGDKNGLPLLIGHDDAALIGRVKDIRLDGKKLRGVLHFSDNSKRAREAWADVQDGFLTDVSIRYQIDEIKETIKGDETIAEITRWIPTEASVVAVPADNTVGINRSKSNEGKPMTKKVVVPESDDDGGEGAVTVVDFEAARTKAKAEGTTAGQKLERQRVSDIQTAFTRHAGKDGVNELMAEVINKGTRAEAAKDLLLEFLSGDPEPAAGSQRQAEGQHGQKIEAGKDEADKWVEGVTESIEYRGGLITDKEKKAQARQSEFFGMSLQDIARHYLVRANVNMAGLGRQQIAGMSFMRAGMHGTSDFANVLENVANKALLMGYDEAPETWHQWCRTGNLSDFKPASRVNISSFSDLEQVLESDEYKEGHLSDLKETITLAKYGKLFHISREAIINDDLDSFTRIPQAMGRAAARTVGDLAYAILTANAALNQDATTLFHANHGNIGTGGVITETTLDEFGVLFAAQTSPAPGAGETGAVLNLRPKFLLVPRAKLMTAKKVAQTPTAPDTAGDLAINTQANEWEIISDARLDADSAVEYYAAADPNQADTVEVAFLDGNDQPFMESQNGFTQDGVAYKVRIEAAAAALDFRGLATNAGA